MLYTRIRSKLGPVLLVHWIRSNGNTCKKMDTCYNFNGSNTIGCWIQTSPTRIPLLPNPLENIFSEMSSSKLQYLEWENPISQWVSFSASKQFIATPSTKICWKILLFWHSLYQGLFKYLSFVIFTMIPDLIYELLEKDKFKLFGKIISFKSPSFSMKQWLSKIKCKIQLKQ